MRELLRAGCTVEAALGAQFSLLELKVRDLESLPRLAPARAWACPSQLPLSPLSSLSQYEGIQPRELIAAGISSGRLRSVGYSARELRGLGFTAHDLNPARSSGADPGRMQQQSSGTSGRIEPLAPPATS